jgi:hypothetical protein
MTTKRHALFGDQVFSWGVSPEGHYWTDLLPVGGENRTRLLTDEVPLGERDERLAYKAPGKVVELYRRLAEVEPTPKGILPFANTYGMLGRGYNCWPPEIAKDHPPELLSKTREEMTPEEEHLADRINVPGEPFIVWKRAILKLRRLIALWEAIERQDERLLRQSFRWEDSLLGAGWVYRYTDHRGKSAKVMLLHVVSEDVFTAAKSLLYADVNTSLEKDVAPLLSLDPETKEGVIQILPATLLGAIWWQFAQVVQKEVKYQTCKVCGKGFPKSTKRKKGMRSDALYCGPACRDQHYRERVRQALRLRADGKSLRDIAQQLDTDIDQVKKWLTPRKRKGTP